MKINAKLKINPLSLPSRVGGEKMSGQIKGDKMTHNQELSLLKPKMPRMKRNSYPTSKTRVNKFNHVGTCHGVWQRLILKAKHSPLHILSDKDNDAPFDLHDLTMSIFSQDAVSTSLTRKISSFESHVMPIFMAEELQSLHHLQVETQVS